MSYTLTRLPGERIIIYDQDPVRDPSQSIGDSLDAVAAMLDEQPSKTFVIYNVGAMKIELDELMQAATHGGRGSNAVLHHPNLWENVYVVSNTLVQMAIKGLESATFGRAKVALFGTLDEALAYCREQIGPSDL